MAKGGLKMKTVAELLKAKPARIVSVRPELSVLEAIKVLASEDIGAALVMTGARLVGILSERDYTRKIVLKGRSSDTTRVEEIMTHPVMTVSPDHTIDDCMRIITDHRVRHLPVIDGDKLVGVISIGDLVRATIAHQAETIDHLHAYISGRY